MFRFGPFELDPWELRRGGKALALCPKPLCLLRYLVANHHRTVSRTELLGAVWSGVRVSEGSLSTAVHALRRVLAGSADVRIATFRGRGYRFMGSVSGDFPAAVSMPALPSPLAPTVDTCPELGRLCAALDHAAAGNQRTVVVHGPERVGKSSLLDALARAASQRGVDVFCARGHQGPEGPAFWPWIAIVRAMVERRGVESATLLRESAWAKLHALGPKRSVRRTTSESAAHDRFGLIELFSAFLRVEAAQKPLALILDDLESSDAASVALFSSLAAADSLHGLLLVGAARTPGPGARPHERQRHDAVVHAPRADRIALSPRPTQPADAALREETATGRPSRSR